MAYYLNSAEAAASGTTVTTANSADNGAGNALTVASGGTRIYDNSWFRGGTRSWKVTGAAGTSAVLGWSGGTSLSSSFRCYFKFDTLPASTCAVFQARNSTGHVGEFQVQSNGKFRITDSAAGGASYTTTATLSTGTTYRFEARLVVGTATTGYGQYALFVGDSTTPLETTTQSAWNLGTTAVDGWRWGKVTAAPAWDVWFDEAAWEDSGTALLGPLAGTSLVAYTTDQVVEVDTTGSVGTMTLTQTGGTTATITGPTGGVFKIVRPVNHRDVLSFDLSADGDGPAATTPIYIYPDNLTNELIYVGGGATNINNWH